MPGGTWKSVNPGTATVDANTGAVTGVSAGDAVIRYTVSNGLCSDSVSTTVRVNPKPSLNSSDTDATDVLCHGGNTGRITVVGGFAGYSSGGDSWQPGPVFSGLTAGTYQIRVKTAGGCISDAVPVEVGEPEALTASADVTSPVPCHGGNGTVSVSVSGGTAPYRYSLDGGAGQDVNIFTVTAGTHSVTVRDANGCETAVTGIAVGEPPALDGGTVSPANVAVCSGTKPAAFTSTAAANGGTAPRAYQWQKHDGTDFADIPDATEATYAVTDNLTATALYRRKTTDANSCTAYSNTVNPNPSAGEITGESSICINGTVTLSSSMPGGTWKSVNPGTATVTAGVVTGVSAGVVDIRYTVTDPSSGCSDSTSYAVTVKAGKSDYPDIRLRICPSVGTVNLSKYIDTVGAKVLWSSAYPLIQPNGDLNASNIHAPGTYTFTYTVTTACFPQPKTGKAYVTALGNGDSPRIRDTVRICYVHAQAVNVNQLFGLETGGTLSYDPDIEPYITTTDSGGVTNLAPFAVKK
jgi:uncharacterized protein YjdB